MGSRNPRPLDNETDSLKAENELSFMEERIAIRMVEAGQSEEEAKRGAHEDWARYNAPGWRPRR